MACSLISSFNFKCPVEPYWEFKYIADESLQEYVIITMM